MKNQILTTLFVLVISATAFSQNFEVPKKGAKLYVKSNSLEIAQEGETTFDIYLVKSRSAKRTSFENPRFLAPEGLDFYLKRDVSDASHYSVLVKANGIERGNYSVTVSGKTSGIHSVTGTILSFNVLPPSTVASTDGE